MPIYIYIYTYICYIVNSTKIEEIALQYSKTVIQFSNEITHNKVLTSLSFLCEFRVTHQCGKIV